MLTETEKKRRKSAEVREREIPVEECETMEREKGLWWRIPAAIAVV